MGPGGMGGEEGSSGEGSEVLTARERRGGKGGGFALILTAR